MKKNDTFKLDLPVILKNNRFLVEPDKKLGINDYNITSVSFNNDEKQIILGVVDNETLPIKKIDSCYNCYTLLDFKISFLSQTGEIYYSENYEDCKITSYQHSKLDYHDDTEHILYIKLTYDKHYLTYNATTN